MYFHRHKNKWSTRCAVVNRKIHYTMDKTLNQSKHIYIVPNVTSESEVQDGREGARD